MSPGRALPSGAFAAFLGAVMLCTGTVAVAAELAKQAAEVDLTQWPVSDIASVKGDPFGVLVKYGYALFTDTANQIGPTVADPARRFAGNNLACGNCHCRPGANHTRCRWLAFGVSFRNTAHVRVRLSRSRIV